MKTETEIGIMLPQVREYLGLPEAGRDKDLPLEWRKPGFMDTLTLVFQPPEFLWDKFLIFFLHYTVCHDLFMQA